MSTLDSYAMEPAPTGSGLRGHLEILRRYRRLIAATCAAGLVLAIVISMVLPPRYRAAASLVVDQSGSRFEALPNPLGVTQLPGLGQPTMTDTFTEIVKSRAVAELAVDRLGVPGDQRAQIMSALRNSLDVKRIRGTDFIAIEMDAPTPEAAAARANAVADAFVAWRLQRRKTQASAAAKFIEGLITQVGRELRAAEDALTAYKIQAASVSITEQVTLALSKIADLEAERRLADVERQAVEASLRRARAELAEQSPRAASSVVTAPDPVADGLRRTLADLEVELVGLNEQFTEQHPLVIATRARIEDVKAKLRALAQQRIASQTTVSNPVYERIVSQTIDLEVQRDALAAKSQALSRLVDTYAAEAASLPPKEQQLARLTRDFLLAQQTYQGLFQKLQEARIAEASIVGDVSIVDRAAPPTGPYQPRPLLYSLLGLVVGALVAVGTSYGLEALDETFKSPDEVERVVGLPVLGAIPLLPRSRQAAERALLINGAEASPFAEAIRQLRTGLLHLATVHRASRFMVTSPGPGEGKTTVAANVAVALSSTGRRVWLVECELRQPSLAATFQSNGSAGLGDLLADGRTIADVLAPTAVRNLWLVPAGKTLPDPAEHLGGPRMQAFLRDSTDGAELLVLDAPPVLPVADAGVLAARVDGVILVVQIRRTSHEAAVSARRHLESLGARILGVVVNGAPAYKSRYPAQSAAPKLRPPAIAGIFKGMARSRER